MHIERIELIPVPMGNRDFLVSRVVTDDGIEGVGEPYPIGPNRAVSEVIADFGEWLTGRDPRDITGIWQELYAHSRFPGGSVVNAAISGIEHALWDILGKSLGAPVYQLLGGRARDRIRVYQGFNADSPERCVEAARSLVEVGGYTAVKMDPLPPAWQSMTWLRVLKAAAARVEAVRDAVGDDVDIAVDVHARIYEPMHAVQLADVLGDCHPLFIEEPLRPENIGELAWYRSRVKVPVATGEMLYTPFEFGAATEAGAVDIVQPDIGLCGGLLQMKKIAALAETHYVMVAPHNPLGPVSTAVNVHFAASTHNFLILEYIPDDTGQRSEIVEQPVRYDHGYLELPDTPGLGVELKASLTSGNRSRNWRRPGPLRPDGAAEFV